MTDVASSVDAQQVIIVIDDEPGIQRLLHLELTLAGFEVVTAGNGEDGLRILAERPPDAVLLDLLMPGMSGMDVLTNIKQQCDVPVVLLTAKADEATRMQALSLGADDVLGKPFSPADVTFTLRMLLAHGVEGLREAVIRAGSVEIDLHHQEARLGDKLIPLSRSEWLLLQHLAEHPGRPRLNQELLTAAWGPEYRNDIQFLRVWMRRLSTKLGDDRPGPKAIRPYLDIGYTLNVNVP